MGLPPSVQLLFQLVQQVQSLQRAEGIYLRPAQLVDDLPLRQGRQGYLILLCLHRRGGSSGFFLQLAEDFLGPIDYRGRQAN